MPVTYSPCPRPILKRPLPSGASAARPPTPRDEPQQLLAIDPSVLQPLVHFPPNPALVSTHPAYSAAAYDRSPIVVIPNQCALPARGCPGRTYTLGDAASYAHERARERYAAAQKDHARERARGKHHYPRGAGLSLDESSESDDADATPIASPLAQTFVLPPLVPDLSSESEESDSFTSPPPEFARITAAASSATSMSFNGGPKLELNAAFSSMQIGATSPAAHPLLPHSPPSSTRRTSHSPRRTASPRRRSNNARSPTRGPDVVRAHRLTSASPVRYKTFSDRSTTVGVGGFGFSAHEPGCLDGF